MRRLAVCAVPVVALCAVGATACGAQFKDTSSTDARRAVPLIAINPKTRAVSGAPAPASGIDLHSASAVALAEVEATWTLNTVLDTGWYAGQLAATAYMTPRSAAFVRKNPPLGSPGATWIVWAAHRATTSVTASIEVDPGGPRDSALTAYRKAMLTVTPHGTGAPRDPNGTGTPTDTGRPINGARANRALAPDDPATTDETGNPGAGEWVGQPQIWVTYLVLTRGTRRASWRVAQSETTR
jgi:hypothetical protein